MSVYGIGLLGSNNGNSCLRYKCGKEIEINFASQQELSNIYHRHLFIRNTISSIFFEEKNYSIADIVNSCFQICLISRLFLGRKYNGEVLDWIPSDEIEERYFEYQNTRKILIEKIGYISELDWSDL